MEISTDNKGSSGENYLQTLHSFLTQFRIFDLLVIGICLISFGFGWIESIVNNDNLHWGWAYIAALDIKHGAIPHSEVIIFYGYVYTLIQSFALTLFGERLMSVGMVTALFYAVTLLLSYLIFLRFLRKSLAFVAVLLIFLIHPYIIYPFPNYIAYTFQLLALLIFLKYPDKPYLIFLSGFFLCLSVLSRYSSVIAIVPPFLILLVWEYLAMRQKGKIMARKVIMMSCGFLLPLTIFFVYLYINSALDDFFYQNRMLAQIIGRADHWGTWLSFFAHVLQIDQQSLASDLRGKIFTFTLLACLYVMIREGMQKNSVIPSEPQSIRQNIMAAIIVAVFGYLNSVHVYETFRLVNGASLGIGVGVFVFDHFFHRSGKLSKYILISVMTLLMIMLSSTLLFKVTTSSYYPWKMDTLLHNGVKNDVIGIFRGKILTKEYNDFYQEAYDAIAPYKNSCYIINYTQDCVAFAMNGLPRIQIAPEHFPWLDDVSRQAQIIHEQKAVILSRKPLDFDGYHKIFKRVWPDEIPWLGGGYLFIYAPRSLAPVQKKLY